MVIDVSDDDSEHWWQRVIRLEDKTQHHEHRLNDHESKIGKMSSNIHDLLVTIALASQQSAIIWKFVIGTIAVLLMGLASKFFGLI